MMSSEVKSNFFEPLIMNGLISKKQFKKNEDKIMDFVFEQAKDSISNKDYNPFIT